MSLCPPEHPHNAHCYRGHGCRCASCKKAMVFKRMRQQGEELKSEATPCLCGCGELTWSSWVPGHHKRDIVKIRPAGMSVKRALELANGAVPREVVR